MLTSDAVKTIDLTALVKTRLTKVGLAQFAPNTRGVTQTIEIFLQFCARLLSILKNENSSNRCRFRWLAIEILPTAGQQEE